MTVESHWFPAYVGVGSNLENPAQQVEQALQALGQVANTQLVLSSALYRNPPMGPQDQPDYVNAVAGLVTRLEPEELLGELQALETQIGRVRTAGDRWGPRIIDLDLLVYGVQHVNKPGLTLPHPGISERNFVLLPLCDFAPKLHVPGQGVAEDLAQKLDPDSLQRV